MSKKTVNPYKGGADYNGTPAQRLDAFRSTAFEQGRIAEQKAHSRLCKGERKEQ